MGVTIYHNPRCSKSRQTLAIIESKGIKPTIVEYLNYPPSKDALDAILTKLGYEDPRELMRTSEAPYKELGLARTRKRDTLLKAMVDYPILIERPIVVSGKKAIIGRPPENVMEIL